MESTELQETSAKDNKNIDGAFKKLAEKALAR
jgi:hypothetical protein